MMKKSILLFFALALALSLSACGGQGSNGAVSLNSSAGTDGITAPSGDNPFIPDLGTAIGGTAKLSDYDEISKQAMIAAAKAAGGDLEFRTDGTVVFTYADGSAATQYPDGSWEMTDADGGKTQFAGSWPDNEYTRLIPKPGFTVIMAGTADNTFVAAFADATVDDVKAYVRQCQKEGFNQNDETTDQEVQGAVFFNYTADNGAGYTLTVYFMSGQAGLSIEKQ
jgi:hypothetical protein